MEATAEAGLTTVLENSEIDGIVGSDGSGDALGEDIKSRDTEEETKSFDSLDKVPDEDFVTRASEGMKNVSATISEGVK